MNTDFPKSDSKFIKAEMFQDSEIPLTFKGWEKMGNVDKIVKGQPRSWKESLKFCLRYSYPQFARDEAGEQRLGKDGKPFQNRNYDPKFPQGYTIKYFFEEGEFDSGSLPLWNAFCVVNPKPGELLVIGKTGKDKETKWSVRRISKKQASFSDELPEIQIGEGEEAPF